jgi:hypothetical protein
VILDPRGGLQALMAKHYRSSNVYNIESSPLIISFINKDFREFSGGIYSHNSWPGLGRSWLQNNDMKFDIIDIPLTGITPSGSFGISEDYRCTVEAFKVYLSHLKEKGLLSIHLYIVPPPRMELRILNTAVKAMEEQGVGDAAQRIIAIRSWGSVCILIKKSPFTFSEIGAVRTFAREKRFDTVHCPGIREEETTGTSVYRRTSTLLRSKESLTPKPARNLTKPMYSISILSVMKIRSFTTTLNLKIFVKYIKQWGANGSILLKKDILP